MSKHYYIMTFGCQQNVADSEKIAGMALQMGYEATGDVKDADLIVVNTCAIREHAENKAMSAIGHLKRLKEQNRDILICVCGCMAGEEHRREELKQSFPYVDIVFDTSSLSLFPELVQKKLERCKRIFSPLRTEYLMKEGLPIHRESNYRAWVSVMYGCNNFCTYCIVPYVRGRERSRKWECIEDEVKDLVERGYKDITLLGQNVNSYGKNLEGNGDFADLLQRLDKIPGEYNIRFMTSHPKDASEKLLSVMGQSEHIAHQFHLPLQSGSDRILKAMNRHYDKERYLKIVDFMRHEMPDVTLTSDIIAGFPGETEEDFNDTLEMLKTVKFDMLYSFIYSPRKGTPASTMEQLPDEVKSERYQRILDLQNPIANEINQRLLHKPMRILCDGVSHNNPAIFEGRTDGNKIVFFEGQPEDVGKFITFEADRADAFALYGKKVN